MRRHLFLVTVLCLLFSIIVPAWADGPAVQEITIQQAIEKAKLNSKALKNAKYDIERSDYVRDFASDNVKYTPSGPTPEPAARAFTGLMQADLNWRMTKRTLTAQEDTVVMQTYQLYYGLLQAQDSVKVAEAQLKSADWKHKVADASFRVGILDRLSLVQAESDLEKAKADYESSQKSLADAYQKFNQLIGLSPEDRPVLVDRPKYEELKIDNLDAEVERALVASPTVWLSQQKIDLAKLAADLYDWSSSSRSEPHEAKLIDVKKAEINVSDTKEQTRKLVRSIYYKTIQLEESYGSMKEKVKTMEEALRIAQIKYNAGMSTMGDVISAEYNLVAAQKSLLDILSQHEQLSYAFRKPWAYAASPDTSSSSGSGS